MVTFLLNMDFVLRGILENSVCLVQRADNQHLFLLVRLYYPSSNLFYFHGRHNSMKFNNDYMENITILVSTLILYQQQSNLDFHVKCHLLIIAHLDRSSATGLMSYLRYLCLLAWSGVQQILCCVFVYLHLVYPMLPVSLDHPFFISPSVLSNVYFRVMKNDNDNS
jgi:hypothetical protein